MKIFNLWFIAAVINLIIASIVLPICKISLNLYRFYFLLLAIFFLYLVLELAFKKIIEIAKSERN